MALASAESMDTALPNIGDSALLEEQAVAIPDSTLAIALDAAAASPSRAMEAAVDLATEFPAQRPSRGPMEGSGFMYSCASAE